MKQALNVASNLSSGSSFKLFFRHCGRSIADFISGQVYNIGRFRDNALILSSFIVSVSRIFVANQSAQKAQGRSDGLYRYKEAVKTTVREALGFALTYIVLRTVQRSAVDLFKNYLWVQKGIHTGPSLLNKLYRSWNKVPTEITRAVDKPIANFPSFGKMCKEIGGHFKKLFNGKLSPNLKPYTDLERLFAQRHNKGVIFHPDKADRFKKLEPIIDFANRLVRKDPSKLTPAVKLQTAFEVLPVLAGSVPALLLSGLWLEKFSQRHAENIAQNIAGYLSDGNKFLAAAPQGSSKQAVQKQEKPFTKPITLPYALNNMVAPKPPVWSTPTAYVQKPQGYPTYGRQPYSAQYQPSYTYNYPAYHAWNRHYFPMSY